MWERTAVVVVAVVVVVKMTVCLDRFACADGCKFPRQCEHASHSISQISKQVDKTLLLRKQLNVITLGLGIFITLSK